MPRARSGLPRPCRAGERGRRWALAGPRRRKIISVSRGRSRASGAARLCAIAALLLYPLLAALHFACDEAHLSGGHHLAIAKPDPGAGQAPAHVHGPGHSHGPSEPGAHRFCDFCVLAGAMLLAPAASISRPEPAVAQALGGFGDQLDANRNRPRDGNPARAPPRPPM